MREWQRIPYALLGAPVAISRRLVTKTSDRVEQWASEGERLLGSLRDEDVPLELDQMQEHVGRLRNQLEHLMATWRAHFDPETGSRSR